jgi:DNA polymerase-3 subunit beta
MGYQDVRSYLNGLLLEIVSKKISFVATDGHRLSMTQVELESEFVSDNNSSEDPVKIIMPRKAVLELMRLLDHSPDKVNVFFSDNNLKFDLGNIVFTTKLLEGSYPDYTRVIPKAGPFCLKARTDMFKQALNSVSVLASEQYNGVLFGLKNDHPEMVLQTYNPEQEIAHASIPVDYEGKDVSLGFNIRYLNDVLGVISTDDFQLTLESDQGSALIKQTDEPNTQYVVMPIRI